MSLFSAKNQVHGPIFTTLSSIDISSFANLGWVQNPFHEMYRRDATQPKRAGEFICMVYEGSDALLIKINLLMHQCT